MKKAILALVLLMVFTFFFWPWFNCPLPTLNNTNLTGAQMLYNYGELESMRINCAPKGAAAIQMAVYILLMILAGTVTQFTLKSKPGPVWYWTGLLVASITGLVLLFISTIKVLTDCILFGTYLSLFTNFALIIVAIIGLVVSIRSKVKTRTGIPDTTAAPD